jgi:D-alanyl-lipoteichoic acid acyltransferase DltB (MBOAT superfamily)
VFLLSGLWHGAAWTFVFWGGLHGLFYLTGKYTFSMREQLRQRLKITGRAASIMQVVITFNLVSLAWVFFRAETIQDAFSLIRNMFINLDLPVRMLSSQFSTALAFGFALVFVSTELMMYWADRNNLNLVKMIPPVIRYPGYACGLLVMALFGVSSNEFIYFQF